MSFQIWTEKYRPAKLDEVIGQKHVVERLKVWAKEKSTPNMIFAGPAGTGKCIAPGTPILLPNNEVLLIEEAFRRGVKEVLTLDKDGKISKGKVKYFYKTKKNKLLKITTRSGSYVVTTPEHPFLVLDDGSPKWIEAKNIKKESLVASPLRIPFVDRKKRIEIDWKKFPNLWAVLEDEISIETHKLYEGLQAKVLCFLEYNFLTCKEISKGTGIDPRIVGWATRTLYRKGLLKRKEGKPLKYALKNKFIKTNRLPLKEVKDDRKIVKIFHKGKFHKPSYAIRYFRYVTPELMEWVAMVLADGNIRESSIRFFNKDNKMLERFKRLTFEVLGEEIKWGISERMGVPYFDISSGTAPKILRYLFNTPADIKKSDTVELPMRLMANKELVSAFIRGYYQCDGYFSSKRACIEISSASKTLIYQMKYIFLFFGIVSRVFKKKRQYYLHISGWENILKFKGLTKPKIKPISYNRIGSTNTDVMEVNKKVLRQLLTSLGIRYQDIAKENEVNYVFDRRHGGRKKVQKIYKRICELSREKISKAMECISILTALGSSDVVMELEKDISRVFQYMNTSQKRRTLENAIKIRSDTLKLYHERKREPGIYNFLSMLNHLRELKITGMEKTYNRLMNILLIRRTILETMYDLGISFSQIATQLDTCSANISNYMQSHRLTPTSICKLPCIMERIKQAIEERILDQTLISELATLQFLSTCEIYWDRITKIEVLPGGTVYDLNVAGTHNFIGGHGAIILHNTTCSIALAKEIFGKNWHQNFQETNSSDERGIDVVRGRIKEFARSKPIGADFKIIFLDESDNLTPDAQQALRRTMERFSDAARFILSCVTPDTKILLPEEVEISIGEFMERFEKKDISIVTTLNEKEKQITDDQVLCSIKMDPQITRKQVFELTTGTGRKLKVTEDHPILTDNGWKRVSDLNIDDRLVVYPHLEGTRYENDNREVFKLNDFLDFLTKKEISCGYNPLGKAKNFDRLDSAGKESVLKRVQELNKIIESGSGLTEREYQIYKIIQRFKRPVQIKEFQNRVGFSIIWTRQLVKQIENKGYIQRCIDDRVHYLKTTDKKPIRLRNKMDIHRIIKKEFGIDFSFAGIVKHLSEREIYKKGFVDGTIEKLKQNNLIDIRYNNNKIGPLTRIFAFIYGDGHMTKLRRTIVFTGNREALKQVKKDLRILGFEGSEITDKKIDHFFKNRRFTGTTTSFRLNSDIFIRLLEFLGAPVGDKIVKKYKIPDWVMNGTKFVKREFLRSLYGCEGYSPKAKKMNFEAITLRMHKSRRLKRNMLYFLRQVKSLLKEFDVDSYIKIRKLNYLRKDGHVTDSYELMLKSSNENLFRFFTRIGYAYEKEKDIKARLASEYLRHKLFAIKQREAKAVKVLSEVGDYTKTEITKEYDCTTDFISDRINGKEIHLPRSFPSLKKWTSKFHFGNGLVLNELIEIKEMDCNDVRDITCFRNHNFIANGIVSHNCNYSSRLIEPIASRCAVFRFRRLEPKDVEKYIHRVVAGEKLHIDKEAIEAIVGISNGDLRRATNLLQACATRDKITKDVVYEISAQARPKDVAGMLEHALNGDFQGARKLLYDMLINQGLAAEDIVRSIHTELFNLKIDDKDRLKLVEKLGEYEFRLNQGATPEIQLEAFLAGFLDLTGKK